MCLEAVSGSAGARARCPGNAREDRQAGRADQHCIAHAADLGSRLGGGRYWSAPLRGRRCIAWDRSQSTTSRAYQFEGQSTRRLAVVHTESTMLPGVVYPGCSDTHGLVYRLLHRLRFCSHSRNRKWGSLAGRHGSRAGCKPPLLSLVDCRGLSDSQVGVRRFLQVDHDST